MSSVEVDQLVAAVKTLAAAPAGDLADAVVMEELLALRALADVAEAAYLSRLGVFHTRGLAETEDGLSTRAWLRHHAHIAPGETSRAVKTAKALTGLPVVAAALAAGEIRLPHATALTDAASLLGADVIAGCQDALVDAARTDEPSKLRAALRGYGAATDNKRAVREAERRDQGRWLDTNTTLDGVLHIHGVLGAEDGAIVKAAIDALAAPDTTHPRASHGPDTGSDDTDTGAAAAARNVNGADTDGHGADVDGTGSAGADTGVGGDTSGAGHGGRDMRSSAQRRADALVELCRRQLDGGDLPTTGGEAAHLLVITHHDTLHPPNTNDHGDRHTSHDHENSHGHSSRGSGGSGHSSNGHGGSGRGRTGSGSTGRSDNNPADTTASERNSTTASASANASASTSTSTSTTGVCGCDSDGHTHHHDDTAHRDHHSPASQHSDHSRSHRNHRNDHQHDNAHNDNAHRRDRDHGDRGSPTPDRPGSDSTGSDEPRTDEPRTDEPGPGNDPAASSHPPTTTTSDTSSSDPGRCPPISGGYGELPDGTILPGEAVRRLACDAKITHITTAGPDSMPLNVGRTRRTATPAQRKALRIRDGGCRFPGCHRPPEWCEAHHVIFWSQGGRTDIDEMVLLCKKHHTTVHEGHWRIRIISPGRFIFTNPHGHAVFAPPPGTTRHLVARLIHLTTTPSRDGPSTSQDNPDAA